MKKMIFGIAVIIVLGLLVMMTGCVRVNMAEKNGPITTRSYDNTGFTGIDIGYDLKLEIMPAASYNVTITAGRNVLDHIRVSQSGSILKIETEGWSFNRWWWQSSPKVTVSMPLLKELYLSGASEGSALGFKSDEDLTVKISGASHLDLDMETGFFTTELSGASNLKGRLTATGSNIGLSGASDIDLTGSGGDIKLHASGASSIALLYYKVNNADVNFSGASDGSLDVSGRLDVKLSGASDLKYAGDPTLGNVDKSDASTLKQIQ